MLKKLRIYKYICIVATGLLLPNITVLGQTSPSLCYPYYYCPSYLWDYYHRHREAIQRLEEKIWRSRLRHLEWMQQYQETIHRLQDEIWRHHLRSSMIPTLKSDYKLAGIDFTAIRLNYFAEYFDQELHSFGYALRAKKASENEVKVDFKDASQLALQSFLVWLTLPDEVFWVNLNPLEPNRVVDSKLGKTDVGKIMLEADFQLKKGFAQLTHPQESQVGRYYWNRLNKEMSEQQPVESVQISTTNRFWIVPDTVKVYVNDNEIYILEAKLNVCLESKYFEAQGITFSTPKASKKVQEYAEKLVNTLILPHLIDEVNRGVQYAALRQIYYSRIVAHWYKEKFGYGKSGVFSHTVGRQDLTGLVSKQSWSADTLFKKYIYSLREGEYNFTDTTLTASAIRIRQYFCGGIDFRNIKLTVMGGTIPQDTFQFLFGALCTPFGSWGTNDSFFGGLFLVSSHIKK